MTRKVWSRLGAALIALSGLVMIGWSVGTVGAGNEKERDRIAMTKDGPEPGGEAPEGDRRRRTAFRLEGEELDRVAWRLYDEEIRKDDGYVRSLDGLPEDERNQVLTENYEDLMTALSESRGSEHASLEAAVDAFRPYARWLKEKVLEDPIDYLAARGAFRVGAEDIDQWTELFVDAFSDEEHVMAALERLDPATARRLYDELPKGARELLGRFRGREYTTIADKKRELRQHLFDLRDAIAADPEGWLRKRGGE